ncbi:MAG: hypothetical protein ACE5JJ_06225 [Nitrospinota bacterium]
MEMMGEAESHTEVKTRRRHGPFGGLSLWLLALALAGCAGLPAEPGNLYRVYGGTRPLKPAEATEPEAHGYTLLGQERRSQLFRGAYPYYLVKIKPGNVAAIDAIQFSSGAFLESLPVASEHARPLERLRGRPDERACAVGADRQGRPLGGFVNIRADRPDNKAIFLFITRPKPTR